MADKKITQLDELALEDVSANDVLPIVDIESVVTLKIKLSTLLAFLQANTTLTQLSDVDGVADAGNILIGDGDEWVSSSPLSIFPSLTGNTGKVLAVNSGEDGLEWIVGGGGGGGVALSDVNEWTATQSAELTTLTYGATVTPDFSLSNAFTLTATGNFTLANPSNIPSGVTSGVIFIVQDGTGNRLISFGSYWKFTNSAVPTLSTTANAVDALIFNVRNSTFIASALIKNLGS